MINGTGVNQNSGAPNGTLGVSFSGGSIISTGTGANAGDIIINSASQTAQSTPTASNYGMKVGGTIQTADGDILVNASTMASPSPSLAVVSGGQFKSLGLGRVYLSPIFNVRRMSFSRASSTINPAASSVSTPRQARRKPRLSWSAESSSPPRSKSPPAARR